MENKKLVPEELVDIFIKLQSTDIDAILVGGQAVNFWASKYRERCSQLNQFLPFSSEDIDFYGGKLEVLTCQQALQGEAKLNRDFEPSPNSGLVLVKRGDRNLRIDFLASVYGLNDAEIVGTAITFLGQDNLSGINFKVLHPILCLEGKLKSLRGIPQQGRQDKKHLKMMILCVKEYLQDLSEREPAKTGLKLIERLISNAIREDGLSAWYHHDIRLESAIALEQLERIEDEKWQKFFSIRFPQVIEQIHSKRFQYEDLMKVIEARRKQLKKNRELEL